MPGWKEENGLVWDGTCELFQGCYESAILYTYLECAGHLAFYWIVGWEDGIGALLFSGGVGGNRSRGPASPLVLSTIPIYQ